MYVVVLGLIELISIWSARNLALYVDSKQTSRVRIQSLSNVWQSDIRGSIRAYGLICFFCNELCASLLLMYHRQQLTPSITWLLSSHLFKRKPLSTMMKSLRIQSTFGRSDNLLCSVITRATIGFFLVLVKHRCLPNTIFLPSASITRGGLDASSLLLLLTDNASLCHRGLQTWQGTCTFDDC